MTLNAITLQAVTRARIEASLGAVATRTGRTISATDAAASTTTYAVPSRTPGQSYEVAVTGNSAGVVVSCNCPAGQHSRPCWHVGLVTLAMEESQAAPVRVGRAA
jgi:uncharacterized Zn finger protein